MGNEFFAMMAFLIPPLFGPFSAMIFDIDRTLFSLNLSHRNIGCGGVQAG